MKVATKDGKIYFLHYCVQKWALLSKVTIWSQWSVFIHKEYCQVLPETEASARDFAFFFTAVSPKLYLSFTSVMTVRDFSVAQMVKESACSAGDPGSIPGSGRSPGGGHGNLLQDSCLENPMDRGAWQATVHGLAKSPTRLSDWHYYYYFSSVVLSVYPLGL